MHANDVRNWLGAYVLILTALLGGYLFLAPLALLPLELTDRTSSFEIIIPFLLGQVAAVYRFYTDTDASHRMIGTRLPSWVVKAPPILVTLLLIVVLTQFAYAGIQREIPPSAETFKGLVTFCVALMNASTVFIISRYFDGKEHRLTAPDLGTAE